MQNVDPTSRPESDTHRLERGAPTLPHFALENMPDGFVALGRDWVYTYVNAEAERLLRAPRATLLDRSIWECFPDLAGTQIGPKLRSAMEHQTTIAHEEYDAPRKIWLETRAVGTSEGMAVYFRDITERRATEEATHRSLVLFRAVTEGTPDIVFIKDLQGHFLMVNTVGARFLGAAAEDIVGKDCSRFFEPELAQILLDSERQVIEGGETKTCEETLFYKGVCHTFLSVRVPYRDSHGAVIGMIGILRDITQQKILRDQLTRSERLAAMGEMVAGVAHELNNPLSAISGYGQLLRRHPDPAVQADAQAVCRMTDRAARIVRSLLTFARETNSSERSPQSLRGIVEETQEMMRYRLRESAVETVAALAEPDLFPWVNAGQIQQVLLNLLTNAEYVLRQRAENRRISLTTCRVQKAGRPWAQLSLSDNGAGIPPEIQGRVFDPFFTTKAQGEGTGLGLAICHGIIEEHGGTITVESRMGEGTTFSLLIPLTYR